MPNYAARIRAARGYADITQQQLANQLGVDVQTIKRRELDPHDERAQPPKKGERIAIASVCGVPLEFMEAGFGGQAPGEISERLRAVEEALQDLRREAVVHEREASQRTAGADRPASNPRPGQQR